MSSLTANTTTWPGIRLDPFGEMYIYDFVSGKPENYKLSRETVQARLTGIQLQVACHAAISVLFIRNLFVVIKTLRVRFNDLPGWCCLLVTLSGIVLLVFNILLATVYSVSCRPLVWSIICAIGFSNVLNTIILLHKAYLAMLRPYWVIVSGVIFIMLQFGFVIIAIGFSPMTIKEYGGCVFNYTDAQSYSWLATVLPVNAFFSAIFSYVVYKQYKTFGSDAWRRLAGDGIQTMCLVILCNIVCGVLLICRAFGEFSDLFFIIDWITTSTILTNHCENMSKAIGSLVKTNDMSRNCNTTRADMKETITTYHGHIRGANNLTSLF